MKASVCFVLELVLFRSEKIFKAHPQNKIMVPLRGYFQNFRRSPPSFLCGSSPPNGAAICHMSNTPRCISRRNKRTVRNETFKRRRNFYPGLNERKKFATGLSPCVPPCLFCSTVLTSDRSNIQTAIQPSLLRMIIEANETSSR